MTWVVYVLVSESSAQTYVGTTTDLERRLSQHNGERAGGARRTTRDRPWRLGASWGPYPDRSEAQRIEYAVKRLRGAARLSWAPDEDDHEEPTRP